MGYRNKQISQNNRKLCSCYLQAYCSSMPYHKVLSIRRFESKEQAKQVEVVRPLLASYIQEYQIAKEKLEIYF